MACRCAPALVQLRRELDARWPERDRASDGCCGDADHATRKSDHNPNAAGWARALDVDEDLRPGLQDGGLIFLAQLALADARTKYVIYEGWLYRPGQPRRRYRGINAHLHHLHLSIRDDAIQNAHPWLPQEEPAMTTTDQLRALLNEATGEGFDGPQGWAKTVLATLRLGRENYNVLKDLPKRLDDLEGQLELIRREIRSAGPGPGVTNPELANALRAAADVLDS